MGRKGVRQDEEKVVILVFWGAFIFLLGTFFAGAYRCTLLCFA